MASRSSCTAVRSCWRRSWMIFSSCSTREDSSAFCFLSASALASSWLFVSCRSVFSSSIRSDEAACAVSLRSLTSSSRRDERVSCCCRSSSLVRMASVLRSCSSFNSLSTSRSLSAQLASRLSRAWPFSSDNAKRCSSSCLACRSCLFTSSISRHMRSVCWALSTASQRAASLSLRRDLLTVSAWSSWSRSAERLLVCSFRAAMVAVASLSLRAPLSRSSCSSWPAFTKCSKRRVIWMFSSFSSEELSCRS
mmetsp:Transcript_8348/g.14148  ORF Transcript_8348/g.14148 Transcript_8348/m.14148 type:complete len:251 (-) Transcript_8348:768-1520(-)